MREDIKQLMDSYEANRIKRVIKPWLHLQFSDQVYVCVCVCVWLGGGGSTHTHRVLGKSLIFLGNSYIFGNSGKQMKLQDEDKFWGENEKYVNFWGN